MKKESEMIAGFNNYNRNYKLQKLIDFHESFRGHLRKQYQAQENNESSKEELEYWDRLLARNTFLMIYSYIEGILSRYKIQWEHAPSGDHEKKSRGDDGIFRFKLMLKEFKGFLGDQCWKKLGDASVLRNCLLHADGYLSLVAPDKRIKLNKCIKNNKEEILVEEDRLWPKLEFCNTLKISFDILVRSLDQKKTKDIRI